MWLVWKKYLFLIYIPTSKDSNFLSSVNVIVPAPIYIPTSKDSNPVTDDNFLYLHRFTFLQVKIQTFNNVFNIISVIFIYIPTSKDSNQQSNT